MKLQPNERVVLEMRKFSGYPVVFPYKKGGMLGKLAYRGVHLYLTDKRIVATLLGKTVLDIPLKEIDYAKKEEKKTMGICTTRLIRIGFNGNEVYLTFSKKEFDLWCHELIK